jgi:hypothetical protein
MSPFDYIKSVTLTKENLINNEVEEKSYSAFMVNRGLSYFMDTLFYAQEMNINHNLDNKLQYDYLLKSIRKSKRFSKWSKKKESEDVKAIQQYYGYSHRRAEEALGVLTRDQVNHIKKRVNIE